MATTIITKFGSGAPAASDVVRGELAVDTENGRLYTENIAGSVVEIGLNPSGNVDVTGTVTTTGNVGIGTTPSFPLDVLGSSTISGRVKTSGALNAFYMEDSGTTASTLYIGSVGDDWRVVTGSNERLRVDSDGKVGIGTSSPSTALTVSGGFDASTAGSKPSITGAGNYGGGIGFVDTNVSGMYTDTSGANLKFFTNQSGSDAAQNKVAMTIDGSGNVGIGTSSPSALVDVNSGAVTAYASPSLNLLRNHGGQAYQNLAGTQFYWNTSNGSGESEIVYGNLGTSYLRFLHNNAGSFSEAMRIDSSGNLLVGTASPNTTANLYAEGSSSNAFAFAADKDVSSAGAAAFSRPDDGLVVSFYRAWAGGGVGSITVTSTTTAYNTSSDQRLKDNIVDAPSASDDIDAIQVRSFDWKVDGSHQKYGMVAQELVTVAPEAVSAPEDPEEMMGVDYSKLVPMMLKEIQSLRARVAQLEGAN